MCVNIVLSTFISPFHFSPPSTPYRRITFFFSTPRFSSPPSLHLLSSNRGGGSLRQAQPPCALTRLHDVTGERLGCPEVYLNKRARACALTPSGMHDCVRSRLRSQLKPS